MKADTPESCEGHAQFLRGLWPWRAVSLLWTTREWHTPLIYPEPSAEGFSSFLVGPSLWSLCFGMNYIPALARGPFEMNLNVRDWKDDSISILSCPCPPPDGVINTWRRRQRQQQRQQGRVCCRGACGSAQETLVSEAGALVTGSATMDVADWLLRHIWWHLRCVWGAVTVIRGSVVAHHLWLWVSS